MRVSIVRALEEQLAAENRRVVSDWRAALLLRRAATQYEAHQRRWAATPANIYEVRGLLRRLAAKGELIPIEDVPNLYEVTSPYARMQPVLEDELVMELHPYAALSHHTALGFHGLTDDFPQVLYVTAPADGTAGQAPIGIRDDERDAVALVRGRMPKILRGHPIQWHRPAATRFSGVSEYRPRGYPVRVTTPERTLVDGLDRPDWCGGLDHVLRAWRAQSDRLDVELVVRCVEDLDVAVLRQRVGFVLERLGLAHPALDRWAGAAKRGGSSKLLSHATYAPTYDERWKLSLNAPLGALDEAAA